MSDEHEKGGFIKGTSHQDCDPKRELTTSVLLIEDETLIRMAIADELRDHGYRVVEGNSAEEGRQVMLADEPISVVITDINLPGASGLNFALWIRKEFPDVNIVTMSGVHEHSAMASAFGHFLAKPFRVEHLIRILKKLEPA